MTEITQNEAAEGQTETPPTEASAPPAPPWSPEMQQQFNGETVQRVQRLEGAVQHLQNVDRIFRLEQMLLEMQRQMLEDRAAKRPGAGKVGR